MRCAEFEALLAAYVDGELDVSRTAAADAHVAACQDCESLARSERGFHVLVRRQPREVASPELGGTILARLRARRRLAAVRPWLLAAPLAVAALVTALPLTSSTPDSSFVRQLVDKHIAYAQAERPAELASASAEEVERWFVSRADLRVTVPDYSPSGIRLLGARLVAAQDRKAAYLFYEKGMTMLSVFMVPLSRPGTRLAGTPVGFRGQEYVTAESKGHHTVYWAEGASLFGLVSMLDYDTLLECADHLRADRTVRTRLRERRTVGGPAASAP